MGTQAQAASAFDPFAYEQWLDEVLTLQQGAKEGKVSVDTLKRENAKGRLEFIRRSERLLGVRRRAVLKIPKEKTAPP
jgi:hypothetical protein